MHKKKSINDQRKSIITKGRNSKKSSKYLANKNNNYLDSDNNPKTHHGSKDSDD